jgi:hypothetical protein
VAKFATYFTVTSSNPSYVLHRWNLFESTPCTATTHVRASHVRLNVKKMKLCSLDRPSQELNDAKLSDGVTPFRLYHLENLFFFLSSLFVTSVENFCRLSRFQGGLMLIAISSFITVFCCHFFCPKNRSYLLAICVSAQRPVFE